MKKMDEKYEFFRILSHELKTPLMIISGASEFLNEKYDNLDKNEHKKKLVKIKDEKSDLIKQMFAENTPGADLKFPNPLPQIEVDCDYIEF